MTRVVSPGAAFCGLMLVSASARADDAGLFVSPGLYTAPTYSPHRATGVGIEISSAYYGNGCCSAWGPLVQAEWVQGRDARGDAFRGALAAQAVLGPLGLDAGWAVRTDAGPTAPWASGPQVGAFFSVGIASIGFRTMLPVTHGTSATETGDTSVVLTIKLAMLVWGETPYGSGGLWGGGSWGWGRMPSGRPLVVDGRARVADAVVASGWADPGAPVRSHPREDGPRSLRVRVLEAACSRGLSRLRASFSRPSGRAATTSCPIDRAPRSRSARTPRPSPGGSERRSASRGRRSCATSPARMERAIAIGTPTTAAKRTFARRPTAAAATTRARRRSRARPGAA